MNSAVQSASRLSAYVYTFIAILLYTFGLYLFNIYSSCGLTHLKNSDAVKKSFTNYWKWVYNLKAVLKDESDCSITVQLTSNSAEVCKPSVHYV